MSLITLLESTCLSCFLSVSNSGYILCAFEAVRPVQEAVRPDNKQPPVIVDGIADGAVSVTVRNHQPSNMQHVHSTAVSCILSTSMELSVPLLLLLLLMWILLQICDLLTL